MKKKGYIPNAMAREFAVSIMKMVTTVMVDIRVGYYAHTSNVLGPEFRANGYDVLLCNTEGSLRYI